MIWNDPFSNVQKIAKAIVEYYNTTPLLIWRDWENSPVIVLMLQAGNMQVNMHQWIDMETSTLFSADSQQ